MQEASTRGDTRGCSGHETSDENSERMARAGRVPRFIVRILDIALSAALLLVVSPLVAVVAIAIKVDDGGTVFFRSARVGFGGREFMMLKFRKMRTGAAGLPLTVPGDERFTRLGHLLAGTKLDELPQLWNVLCGQMSLVGPRPESPDLVARDPDLFVDVLSVKPGITGLAQLAYAREGEVLGGTSGSERITLYFDRILPQKLALDRLYAQTRSLGVDLNVLWWTAVAVVLRKSVAVDRRTGRLGLRQRPTAAAEPMPVDSASLTEIEKTGDSDGAMVSA
jgi:lipopolysaccharide/colanic/teichoic acid biosynthesis glycosyltransferase